MGASASTHAASHTGILSELAGFSEVVESRFLVKECGDQQLVERLVAAQLPAALARYEGAVVAACLARRRPDGHYFHAAPARWTHADVRALARHFGPPVVARLEEQHLLAAAGPPPPPPGAESWGGGGAAWASATYAREGQEAGFSDISELTADDVRESFEDTLHGPRVEAGAAFAWVFGVLCTCWHDPHVCHGDYSMRSLGSAPSPQKKQQEGTRCAEHTPSHSARFGPKLAPFDSSDSAPAAAVAGAPPFGRNESPVALRRLPYSMLPLGSSPEAQWPHARADSRQPDIDRPR